MTETDPVAHRTVRKAVDKGFGATCINEYARIVQNITKHLVRQLRDRSQDPNGVDVKAWSARVTFDVITEVTFGKSFETVARGEQTVWLSLLTDKIAAAAVGGCDHSPVAAGHQGFAAVPVPQVVQEG